MQNPAPRAATSHQGGNAESALQIGTFRSPPETRPGGRLHKPPANRHLRSQTSWTPSRRLSPGSQQVAQPTPAGNPLGRGRLGELRPPRPGLSRKAVTPAQESWRRLAGIARNQPISNSSSVCCALTAALASSMSMNLFCHRPNSASGKAISRSRAGSIDLTRQS